MRAKLLGDLLQADPDRQSERVLDLSFYVVSDSWTIVPRILNEEVLPDISERESARQRSCRQGRNGFVH